MRSEGPIVSSQVRSILSNPLDTDSVEVIVRYHEPPRTTSDAVTLSTTAANGGEPAFEQYQIGEPTLRYEKVTLHRLKALINNRNVSRIVLDHTAELLQPTHVADDSGGRGNKHALRHTEQAWGQTWGRRLLDVDALLKRQPAIERPVRVGVIDTGCANHPALADKLYQSMTVGNQLEIAASTLPLDQPFGPGRFHGTHVCGIICGEGHDVAFGIAKNVKLYVVRMNLSGVGFKTSHVLAAIQYLKNIPVDILNMSFSVPQDLKEDYLVVPAVFNEVLAAPNMLSIAAVGNDYHGRVEFPARLPTTIAVGAQMVDIASQQITDVSIANFSGGGMVKYPEEPAFVPNPVLVAPGQSVLSTYFDDNGQPSYEYLSGTSMAAAHVSGVAAILKSLYPQATAQQLRDALVGSAYHPHPEKRPDSRWGFGMVTPVAAERYLQRMLGGTTYGEL